MAAMNIEVKVRMTEELASAVQEQAVRDETTVSQIVRVALRRYLMEKGEKS